jgi:hypothetical protein
MHELGRIQPRPPNRYVPQFSIYTHLKSGLSGVMAKPEAPPTFEPHHYWQGFIAPLPTAIPELQTVADELRFAVAL